MQLHHQVVGEGPLCTGMRLPIGPPTYPEFRALHGFGLRISPVQHLPRRTQSSLSRSSSIFVATLSPGPFPSPQMTLRKYFLTAQPRLYLHLRVGLRLPPSVFLLRTLVKG